MDFKIKQRPYLLELATSSTNERFIRFKAGTTQPFGEHLVLVDGVEVLFKYGFSISAIQCCQLEGRVKFVVFVGLQGSNQYVFSILERAMPHVEPYLDELE